MEHYVITDSLWEAPLREASLDSLVGLLMYTQGECLSMHSRGSTFRSTLPNGSVVYVKRDHFTRIHDIAAQVLHGRRPVPKSVRETQILQRLSAMGYDVPQVLVYGYRSCLGLPGPGGMVMLPVNGTPLDVLLKKTADASQREKAIDAARHVLERLLDDGVDWPDAKPEHFLVDDALSRVAILDVERATFHRRLSESCRARILQFFDRRVKKAIKPPK